METDCKHICHCPCHTEPMMHFMPCCYKCSHCDEKINRRYVEEHEAQCHDNTGSVK